MSSNIEALRQHYAELARQGKPGMNAVAMQLGIAAKISDEFSGPREFPGFAVGAKEKNIDPYIVNKIIEFLENTQHDSDTPEDRLALAREFNEQIGSSVPDETPIRNVLLPGDRYNTPNSSTEARVAAKRINPKIKNYYNLVFLKFRGNSVGYLRDMDPNKVVPHLSRDSVEFAKIAFARQASQEASTQ